MTRAADLAKLIAGGGSITVADNSENLKLITTDADASVGPTLRMDRQSASAADSDLLGKINFVGHNDAGTPEDIGYAGITAIISDASDGTEDGKLAINTMVAGTERSRIFVDAGETVLNEDSIDLDFRVESNGNANMLVVDGGNDVMSIGRAINTASTLSIQNKDDANNNTLDLFNDNGNRTISMQQDTTGNAKLILQKNDGTNAVRLDANLGGILFGTDTAAANTLDDYEEGTWTPAVTVGSVSTSNGHYKKIGGMVFLRAYVTGFTNSSNNESMYITGVPFTIATQGAVGVAMWENINNDFKFDISYINGSSQVQFYYSHGSSYTEMRHVYLDGSNAGVHFTATYLTDQ